VLAGALLFLGGQLTADLAASRSAYLRDPVYADKLERLRRRGPGGVLVLGTSRAAFGIHTRRLEGLLAEEFGRPVPAFNFGVPGSGPFTHLIYARRLLRDGARPALILVEVFPPALLDRPDIGPEQFGLFGDRLWRDEVDLAIRLGHPADPLRDAWRRSWLTPAYVLRLTFLARLMPSAVPWQLRQNWGRITDDWGWGTPSASPSPELYRACLDRARAAYAPALADFRLGGPAAAALEELLTEARDHGIPAAMLLMPEGHDFQALYPPGADRRLAEFLDGIARRTGAGVVNARDWVADDLFIDSHHLLAVGAAAFTDRLAHEAVVPLLHAEGGRP
jgi:hypothetical protein